MTMRPASGLSSAVNDLALQEAVRVVADYMDFVASKPEVCAQTFVHKGTEPDLF
jgi:hypothetical protein